MLKLRAVAVVALIGLTVIWPMPISRQIAAAGASSIRSNGRRQVSNNKFARRWHAYLTSKSTGERVYEGVINITDINPPSADYVRVVHPRYGGPYLGFTSSDSERIEVHILLGDGRVAHYDMKLVSPDRAEGHFYITGGDGASQSAGHGPRVVGDDNNGSWDSGGGG